MMLSAADRMEKATFAGGCFWCMEPSFEKLEGVKEVISGYTGGRKTNPSYEEVSSGATGHRESIQVIYDSGKINYRRLLDVFWRQIDPTDKEGQFVDRGFQYTSAIFYHSEEQRRDAEESKRELGQSGIFDKPVVTDILPAGEFYPAEKYHQDYYRKSSVKYKYYRYRSGRDQFLKKVWGNETEKKGTLAPGKRIDGFRKPSDKVLNEMLTPLQYKVTQKDGTEKAFENEY
ncbi:MAG TPA: peptide-methionine (S)-S-oxide reductase MsrA, partial [bacterium]|nr:peptide-methionine (S)-S-oxide reductase MsrA [bacterium]